MKNGWKRLTALMLAMAICLSLVSANAWAGEVPGDGSSSAQSGEKTSEVPEEESAPEESEREFVPEEKPVTPEAPEAKSAPEEELSPGEELESESAVSDVPEVEKSRKGKHEREKKAKLKTQGIVASGTCGAQGDNLTWTLDDEGTLTISGSGEMANYSTTTSPWTSKKIKSVVINKGVTSIGKFAFYDCNYLTSVTIPEGVTTISDGAFFGCSNLAVVAIPQSVISIEDCAFCDCQKLTDVTISNGITNIGNHVFQGCRNLSSIIIPDSVEHIGIGAFYYCINLSSVSLPSGLKSIEEQTFAYCEKLTDLPTMDDVTSIGKQAFIHCNGLTQISIPEKVTKIEQNAFSECTNLNQVSIPDSVTTVGAYAFSGCYSLSSVQIGKKVKSMGEGVFYCCKNLSSVNIPEGVTDISDKLFNKCYSVTNISIPQGVTSIGSDAFSECTSLTDITIPDGVTRIESFAFYKCSGLTSVEIPDSVAYINNYAFEGCINLQRINIPNSIAWIGSSAFSGCKSLSSISIPEGVARIDGNTFKDCTSLTSVSIPHSVTSIGSYAFESCSSLNDVYYEGFESDWDAITVGTSNTCLTSATIHYNSKGPQFYPDVDALVPENGSVNVDHFFGKCRVVFKRTITVSGEGSAYLYDITEDREIEKLDLSPDSISDTYELDNTEEGFVGDIGHNVLELCFKSELAPGHRYCITIDEDVVNFTKRDDKEQEFITTEEYFSGYKKSEWAFETEKTDYAHFQNPEEYIDDDKYNTMFRPIISWALRRNTNRGTKGTCYGWVYMIGAMEKGYDNIKSFGKELSEMSPDSKHPNMNPDMNSSLLDYIQYAHLYQECKAKKSEAKRSKDKFNLIYDAIKKHINGTGDRIVLSVYDGHNWHALYPLHLINETDTEIIISVLDCNMPAQTFVHTLSFTKEKGEITGFSYREYHDSMKYTTIDATLDTMFGMCNEPLEISNLIYSSVPLNNEKFTEIDSLSGNFISDSNGEMNEQYLYWTDEQHLELVIPGDSTFGFTDGYTSAETSAGKQASVMVDMQNKDLSLQFENSVESEYSIKFMTAKEQSEFETVMIHGTATSGVDAVNTDGGVIFSTEKIGEIEFEMNNKQAVISTTESKVLLSSSEDSVIVRTDNDGDGEFETVIKTEKLVPKQLNQKLGDLTGDGDITMADVVKLNRFVLGKIKLTDEEMEHADVNHDGDITMADVILLNRYVVGLINTL